MSEVPQRSLVESTSARPAFSRNVFRYSPSKGPPYANDLGVIAQEGQLDSPIQGAATTEPIGAHVALEELLAASAARDGHLTVISNEGTVSISWTDLHELALRAAAWFIDNDIIAGSNIVHSWILAVITLMSFSWGDVDFLH